LAGPLKFKITSEKEEMKQNNKGGFKCTFVSFVLGIKICAVTEA